MSISVLDLIKMSMSLAGVSDPEMDPVESSDTDGRINSYKDIFVGIVSGFRKMFPYIVEKLFEWDDGITNIGAGSICTVFYKQDIFYPLREMSYPQFALYSAVPNVHGIPDAFWYDPLEDKMDVFPLPSTSMTFKIAYYPLDRITSLQQKLSDVIQPFMIEALRYELAERITHENNIAWPASKKKKQEELKADLMNLQRRELKNDTGPQILRKRTKVGPVPFLAYLSGNYPK
jgi:hypothetical protein